MVATSKLPRENGPEPKERVYVNKQMAHVVMDERSSRSVVDRLEGDSGEPMVYVPD